MSCAVPGGFAAVLRKGGAGPGTISPGLGPGGSYGRSVPLGSWEGAGQVRSDSRTQGQAAAAFVGARAEPVGMLAWGGDGSTEASLWRRSVQVSYAGGGCYRSVWPGDL